MMAYDLSTLNIKVSAVPVMDITGITVFNVLALAIIKKSSHGISCVLVLLMKMTELLCRTFIGTNLCPEWERFLVSNVGKYLELCDIEFNINYQDHCCSWNESAVCIIIDEPITDLFCSTCLGNHNCFEFINLG